MSLSETIIVGALTVIFAAPIYALVAKAKKNRILGHKFAFSKTTKYVILLVVIVLWLVVSLVKN